MEKIIISDNITDKGNETVTALSAKLEPMSLKNYKKILKRTEL